MLKTHKEMQTQEVEVADDFICNRCGKPCKRVIEGVWEGAELNADWGYGSRKDGQCHQSHLCEDCYDEIVADFKIAPTISGWAVGLQEALDALKSELEAKDNSPKV